MCPESFLLGQERAAQGLRLRTRALRPAMPEKTHTAEAWSSTQPGWARVAECAAGARAVPGMSNGTNMHPLSSERAQLKERRGACAPINHFL